MPRKKPAKEPEKAQRLSLAELIAHDDVCSDVMVDNVSVLTLLENCLGLQLSDLLQGQNTEESAQA